VDRRSLIQATEVVVRGCLSDLEAVRDFNVAEPLRLSAATLSPIIATNICSHGARTE
jgi:hypothetical protein